MKAEVTRRHREIAYRCIEDVGYEGAAPDGRNWIDGLPVIGEYGLETAIAQALADIEAEALAQVPRWIPCEERMPEDTERVWFFCPNPRGVSKGEFRNGEWLTSSMFAFDRGEVTHWMHRPLEPQRPSPPETK